MTDGNGSGGKSLGKTETKITSSNRFEKLDPDIDCDPSGLIMTSSCTNEDGSPPSAPSPSMSSNSSALYVKSGEDRRTGGGGEERRTGGSGAKECNARGGRSNNRKGVPSRQQVQGSIETQTCGQTKASNAHLPLTDELGSEEGITKDDFRGDGSRKKSSKHIKFDVPTTGDADSSHTPDSSYFSTSASFSSSSLSFSSMELHKDEVKADHDRSRAGANALSNEGSNKVVEDGPLSGAAAPSTNSEQQMNKPKRIVYERVSCL